jgi:glycosyltransferase involved in cell wall biosynthesis
MKAIESIFTQEFSDFEIIVVNDGGSDDTGERIKSITDPRFHYYYKDNAERGAARNFGARKAKGAYINFFDSDDLLYPNHLSTAKALIDRENSPEFFHLGYDFKIDSGELIRNVDNLDQAIQRKAMFDNFLSCNGVFVRKDIAEQFPFEEDRVLASAEDWALWIRLLSRFTIRYSNTITSTVLTHDQRSIHTIPTDKVIRRDNFLIHYLRKDTKVMDSFGYFGWKKFEAQRYTFVMLCLAEDRRHNEVLGWARKAFTTYPLILFSSRFLASCRKAILKS